MKKLFTLVVALFLAATVWAQSGCPQRFSYQAVVRNAANELVTNKSGITVVVEITDDNSGMYRETHTVNSNQNGLISLMIGGEDATNISGAMNTINWANAKFSTTISFDGEVVNATTDVVAAPYALYACEINPGGKVITDIYKYVKDTLNYYYTQEKINDTLNKYYTKTQSDAKFLTVDGLCSQIETSCSNVALRGADNTFSDKNTFTDTVNVTGTAMVPSILDNSGKLESTVGKDSCQMAINYCDMKKYVSTHASSTPVPQVNADWNATSGVAQILNKPTTLSGYGITDAKIENQTITLGSTSLTVLTCETVSDCDNIALRDSANTFDTTNVFTDTVIVANGAVKADGSIDAKDSLRVVNAKDLVKYVNNVVVDTLKYAKFTADSAQVEFTVTLATGSHIITDSRYVRFFINGVFVGTSVDGVVTVNNNKVTYVPAENDGYELVAGDRIQIEYWVKK